MSDASRTKPVLKRCAICRMPVARKKLVFTTSGQPVHRVCRPATDRSPSHSTTPPGIPRAPKDISRAELLKRIEALRKRDAKVKPDAAKKPGVTKKAKKLGVTKKSGTAKVPPARRPKPPAAPHRGKQPTRPPQPYYGVEMKFINGRWVQMHPDSE